MCWQVPAQTVMFTAPRVGPGLPNNQGGWAQGGHREGWGPAWGAGASEGLSQTQQRARCRVASPFSSCVRARVCVRVCACVCVCVCVCARALAQPQGTLPSPIKSDEMENPKNLTATFHPIHYKSFPESEVTRPRWCRLHTGPGVQGRCLTSHTRPLTLLPEGRLEPSPRAALVEKYRV